MVTVARHLFDHSYDTATLAGMRIRFTDGCEGTITGRLEPFARVRSLPSAPHQHDHGYAWETVAWEYIDKGRPFPVR